jgi:predicted RNA-binding Zn ribbon-like protein
MSLPPVRHFEFVGGLLCLDFCNTVGGKRGGITREYLPAYRDLLGWSEQAGLIGKAEAKLLQSAAEARPGEAAEVLTRAMALREAIYHIVADRATGRKGSAADVAILNEEIARTLGRLRVAKQKDGFGWEWAREVASLDWAIGPIVRSAAELLTNAPDLEKVRRCEGLNCGWLFLDASKNHSRRWCDMGDCGNRAKVRRHRLKQKA